MVEIKAMMSTVLICLTKHVKYVAGVIQHYAKVVEFVLFMHMVYSLLTPLSISQMSCPWLSTGHLLHDLYHGSFSLKLFMSHIPHQLTEWQ